MKTITKIGHIILSGICIITVLMALMLILALIVTSLPSSLKLKEFLNYGLISILLQFLFFIGISLAYRKPMISYCTDNECMDRKKSGKIIIISIIASVLISIICVAITGGLFDNDKQKIEKSVSEIQKICPVKTENGEIQSVKIDKDTIVFTNIFYEYKDMTMDVLKENENTVKQNTIQNIVQNKNLSQLIINANYFLKYIYTGNRSHEKIVQIITPQELKQKLSK